METTSSSVIQPRPQPENGRVLQKEYEQENHRQPYRPTGRPEAPRRRGGIQRELPLASSSSSRRHQKQQEPQIFSKRRVRESFAEKSVRNSFVDDNNQAQDFEQISESLSPTYSLDPNDPNSLGYYDGLRLLASRAGGEAQEPLPSQQNEGEGHEAVGRLGYHVPSTLTTVPRDISATLINWGGKEEVAEHGDSPLTHKVPLLTVGTVQADGTRSGSFYLGHLTAMVPLDMFAPFFLDWAVASLLAIHHWNNGISDVLPILSSPQVQSCQVKFTQEYLDTIFSPQEASRLLVQDVLPRPQDSISKPRPTVILGAALSSVTMNLATVSGLAGIPQLSHTSASTSLDNPDEYPLFARLMPSVAGTAKAAASYFHDVLHATHVGVVYVRDVFGDSYRHAFQNAVTELAVARGATNGKEGDNNDTPPMVIHTVAIELICHVASCMRDVMKELASREYRYYFCLAGPSRYDSMMQLAHEFGMAGPGRFWLLHEVFSDNTIQRWRYPEGSSLAQVSHGVGRIRPGGSPRAVKGRLETANFVRAWQTLNEPEFKEFFKRQEPRLARQGSLHKVDFYDFHSVPSLYSELLYDSVVAIGLATCQLIKERGGTNFSSEELYEEIKRTTFEGVSGFVELDSYTGSRKHESMVYTVSNILARDADATGNVTFDVKETNSFRPYEYIDKDGRSKLGGRWTQIEESDPFIYSDLTSTPPLSLPPPEVQVHDIPFHILIAGWAMCGILLASSVLCSLWVVRSRRVPVIRASQPVFLYSICGGTFAMGLSIVPLSAQPPQISENLLDMACMLTWWLYSVGYVLVFSALFAKTLRLNMILAGEGYRRVKVTAWDVLTPLVALMSLNIAVLAVWTLVSPLKYVYIEGTATDMHGRALDLYGQCRYNTESELFAGSLLTMNAVVSLIALFEAFKGRNIVSDFAESKYIFYVLASIIEAFALGIPVVVVSWDSPSASFAVLSGLIFITGMSTLTLLFVPKASLAWKARGRPFSKRASSMSLGALDSSNRGSNFPVHSREKQSLGKHRFSATRDSRTRNTENTGRSNDQGRLEASQRSGFDSSLANTDQSQTQPLFNNSWASIGSLTENQTATVHLLSATAVPPEGAGFQRSPQTNHPEARMPFEAGKSSLRTALLSSFFRGNRIPVTRHSIAVFRPADIQKLYDSTVTTPFENEPGETSGAVFDVSTTSVPTVSTRTKRTRLQFEAKGTEDQKWDGCDMPWNGFEERWENQMSTSGSSSIAGDIALIPSQTLRCRHIVSVFGQENIGVVYDESREPPSELV